MNSLKMVAAPFPAQLVLLVFLFCATAAVVRSDDGATLLEIKNSFKDVDSNLYHWTESSDYCTWRGVTCDNVTVISLNLTGFGLDGEISPAIGNLMGLQILELKENNLSGQIPDEIGECSSLKVLDFSFNELHGDIPFSISKLKQLGVLNLRNNKLSGPIPSTLSQIPNLEVLDLAQNELTGEIPRLIYWNEVLQYLGLRSNKLVGTLSPDMCQLSALWYFDVKNNSLTGTIPESIGNCTTFQILDLSYNRLTGVIPENIGYLQVATLSLQNNLLSGPIPPVIGLMQAITVLDLSYNMLTGPIPTILGNLSYTTKLYFHFNKLNGSIPAEFGNMTRLHYLRLDNNQLTGRIPAEFGKLTELFDLSLASNHLEGPLPEKMGACTSLNNLDLFGNKLNGSIPRSFRKLESLTYLNLSSNELQGSIPAELSNMANLDTLDASNNRINGSISPSFGDLEHLLKLNLSRNQILGHIPAEFGNLRSIIDIDLSHNQLSGSLPQAMGQLQYLNSLRLENNHLSGDVATLTDCPSLTVLNLSYNNLAGHLPVSNNFSRFSYDSFIGNVALCGQWNEDSYPCHDTHSTGRVAISKAAVMGIALGALVILLLILLTMCRPRRRMSFPEGSFNKPVMYSKPKLVILHMNMALHAYEDIMRMTENLSDKYIIGHGASSTVYKCVLKNCKPVAIKKLYSHESQGLLEFETELKTVGCIKHRNLISLQGYSLSPSGYLLFYEYMENGSLWDLLHASSSTKKKKLDWATRLNIALGAAQGLSYLHHDCNPRIIHRDVKSSNILLDKDFEPHLTDFGIAKSLCTSKTYISTFIVGTIGYIDPEYARTSRLTEKSDVYSYGVVLLELLTGKRAVDNELNLHHLVLSKTATDAVMEIVDPEITATCKDLGAVKKTFQLALLCTKLLPSERPTMQEITRVLTSVVPAATSPMTSMPPGTKVGCYKEEYENLKTPDMLNSTSISTSDAELFLKFGEVISQNSE